MKGSRRRRRPAPEHLEGIPPSRLEREVARILEEGDRARRAAFESAFLTPSITEEYIARAMDPKNRPSFAATWIDKICANDEWLLMSAKGVEGAISAAIDEHNTNTTGPRIRKKPSYSAIQKELKQRRVERAKT
jgi:hypothetical protein